MCVCISVCCRERPRDWAHTEYVLMVINCYYDDSGETYFDVDGDGGHVNCDGVDIDGTDTEIADDDDDGDKRQ